MKPLYQLSLLVLVALCVVALEGRPASATTEAAPVLNPSAPDETEVIPEDGFVSFATSWDNVNPAIALSTASKQYLAVSQSHSGSTWKINAKFVEQVTGYSPGIFFEVVSVDHEVDNPDVAYDATHNRFLVVWDEYVCTPFIPSYCAYVIKGRLVYGAHQGGSQLAGAAFTIASQLNQISTSYDVRFPSVAYNPDDDQFLVLFTHKAPTESDYRDVYGQMLSGHAVDPEVLGPVGGFLVRDYGPNSTSAPNVSWSSAAAANFLGTWRRQPSAGVSYISVAYLHDTFQDGAGQLIGTWQVAPYDRGDFPLTNDVFAPAVAFDPHANAYVVVFGHDETTMAVMDQGTASPGLDFKQAIYGQRVSATYDSSTFRYDADYAFPIETGFDAENSMHSAAQIAYSGYLYENMHVIYQTYDFNLNGPDFYKLNHRVLNGTDAWQRVQVRAAAGDAPIWDPAIACYDGECLAAWQEKCTGDCPDTWDVWGRLLVTPAFVLFDEAHDEQNTLDWTRAQEIADTIGWVGPQPGWFYYGQLKTNLAYAFLLQRNTSPLTSDRLGGYQALMLAVPRQPLSRHEVSAVKRFVAEGGGLVLLGDCSREFINPELPAAYDMRFVPQCLFGPVPTHNGNVPINIFSAHEAIMGVSQFRLNWGQSIERLKPGTWARLAWAGSDVWEDTNWNDQYDAGVDRLDQGFIVAGAYDTGCGRVVSIADNNFQDDSLDVDNELFMRTILKWVVQGQSCTVPYYVALPVTLR